MANKKRLNFRIVEVSESDRDFNCTYDEFKEDYLNPRYSVPELKKKYDIPPYLYREWSAKIREEEGISRKPCLYQQPLTSPNMHLYKLKDGWGIHKKIDGKMKYFGRYHELETARMVRNKLVEARWDDELALELSNKYGYQKIYNIDEKLLMDKYDEFVHLYLEVPTKYQDILSILKINPHAYNWLVHKVREEYGQDVKKNKLRCYDENFEIKYNQEKIKQKPMRYIRKTPNGKYSIMKIVDGKLKSFGTYNRLDTARKCRNRLEANGWIK